MKYEQEISKLKLQNALLIECFQKMELEQKKNSRNVSKLRKSFDYLGDCFLVLNKKLPKGIQVNGIYVKGETDGA